ncbi:MAG: hypothetical protein AAF597_13055 [Bacteroidota bacterium]
MVQNSSPPPAKGFKVKTGAKKRSVDGQLKLGIWFKNHRLKKMFYIYSPQRFNDYDRELRHLMAKIDSYKPWQGKVESARIYHIGNSTSGPEVLAWQDGEWYDSRTRTNTH